MRAACRGGGGAERTIPWRLRRLPCCNGRACSDRWRTAILAFRPDARAGEIAQALDDAGAMIVSGPRAGWVFEVSFEKKRGPQTSGRAHPPTRRET